MTRRRLDRWWDLITLVITLAVAVLALGVLLVALILIALAGPK